MMENGVKLNSFMSAILIFPSSYVIARAAAQKPELYFKHDNKEDVTSFTQKDLILKGTK